MISIKDTKFQSFKAMHLCHYASLSLILCLFSLSSSLFAMPAEAHVLKTDGTIGVILHVDPGDDPTVGKPSSFFFELKDKTDMFKQSNCICTVTIKRQGNVESTQIIETSQTLGTKGLVSTYTFPQKGVYTIILSGKPNQPKDFTPFELQYDIRVSREESTINVPFTETVFFHSIHYGLFAIGFIILILLVRKEKQKITNN